MSLQPASRMASVKASAIREILKVTERPDVLSFAGGLPAPEAFPVAAIAAAHADVLAREGGQALQYGPTEGFLPLRERIAERLRGKGLRAGAEQVLVTAGSQQGIDLIGKAFIDPGEVIAVEAPSYLAALQSFSTYGAAFEMVESDEHGLRVDKLEQLLRRKRVKLAYVLPTFQNPSGTTLPLERRQQLLELAAAHGVTVIEDDPYGELRFEGQHLPPLAALDSSVIHLGTFSKTLAPGLRLGWAVADERTVRALTIAKQAADLHTNTLSQRAVARLLETFEYETHLDKLRALYGERCRAMLAALERYFPEGTSFTRPQGGLFIWVRLPGGVDAEELLADAMIEKVAFVPGAPFYASAPDRSTLRLNFSNRPPELIADGIARLGRCVGRRLARAA